MIFGWALDIFRDVVVSSCPFSYSTMTLIETEEIFRTSSRFPISRRSLSERLLIAIATGTWPVFFSRTSFHSFSSDTVRKNRVFTVGLVAGDSERYKNKFKYIGDGCGCFFYFETPLDFFIAISAKQRRIQTVFFLFWPFESIFDDPREFSFHYGSSCCCSWHFAPSRIEIWIDDKHWWWTLCDHCQIETERWRQVNWRQ